MIERHLYWLVAVLTVGLGLFVYKTVVLGFPVLPGTKTELWDLEIKTSFVAGGEPVRVSLFIPSTNRYFTVVDEHFVSRGYGLTTRKAAWNRRAVWTIRHADGPQTLYYRAVIQKAGTRLPPATTSVSVPPVTLDDAHRAAAHALFADVRQRSADTDSLVAQLLLQLNQAKADPNVALLLGNGSTPVKRIEAAAQILAVGGVPARLVRGVWLDVKTTRAQIVPWLQVHDGKQWRPFDPSTGEPGVPDDYLFLWQGSEPFVRITGARKSDVTVSTRRSEQAGVRAAAVRGGILHPRALEFSLFSLPVATQEVYRVLLLVPVGALLLVIMRNVIGVKTFGTFMPVLIALAFRETQLLWGIILFSLVVALGLGIRFYLEQLKLLLVPRLASVLIVVIGLMALISVLSHKLGLEHGLSVALFPMVIMTMTIERMSIVWEERGPGEALQQGIGSLAAAALVYLVMSNEYMDHLMFVFPELLLVLLAGTLLLGRYSGYRLLELRRFKALAKEPR